MSSFQKATFLLLLPLTILFGAGCRSTKSSASQQNKTVSQASTSTKQIPYLRYRDTFLREAKPSWIHIRPDHYSLSVPYSSEWLVDGGIHLSQYETDEPIENQMTIRFGRPADNGTYAIREYFIYRKPRIQLDLSSQSISVEPLKDELSCVDGFEARMINIGSIKGIEHHIGGAKGCAEGFAFNVGKHVYFLYHIPDMGDVPTGITDEMKKIIESVRE